MIETVEKEWLERDRRKRGTPIGLRQFKTEFEADRTIEDVILEIAKPMEERNQEKEDKLDQGIFCHELLEEVFLGNDNYWRYVVSMSYIRATNEIRERNQAKRNGNKVD